MMKLFFFLISLLFMVNCKKNFLLIQNYYFFFCLVCLLNFNLSCFFWMIYFFLGVDSLSLMLIILTGWILGLSFMANKGMLLMFYSIKFFNVMMSLMIMLTLTFMSMNMFMFYIFFEGSLIPMVMIIMGWGMQIDRIQASMYMLMYTIFGSLPLMAMMIYIFMECNSLFFSIILLDNLFFFKNLFLFMILMLGFMVKMPLYFVHIWLPKAHVEAPVSGSMILAGIMLKLGSYGIFRFIPVFNYLVLSVSYLFIMLSMVGGIYASLVCLNQVDMKIIVAYSSIVHMNMLLASMLCMSVWGMTGSIMIMVAHGLNSSMLFCLVNLVYERTLSRSLLINKGLMNLLPSLSMWWFLACLSNFSVPPSLSLFGEIYLIVSLMSFSKFMMMLIFMMLLFSAWYSIYLYIYSQHGVMFNLLGFNMISIREFLILLLHWVPLNLMFIKLLMF